MDDLIQLTEAEIAAVAGGLVQTISISARQSNTSSVTQAASATNSGRITATATGTNATVAAVGAAASNLALVAQRNAIVAANIALYN